MKKRKAHLDRLSTKPEHEKLPWPGLTAKDHLSRVATRAVKEAKQTRENEVWAENLIARVLSYVPLETAFAGNVSSKQAQRYDANASRIEDGSSRGMACSNRSRNPNVIRQQVKENKAVVPFESNQFP